MRSTVSFDDELLKSIREFAEKRGVTFNRAVIELVHRGLSADCPIQVRSELAVLTPGPLAPKVSPKDVARIAVETP